MRNNSNAFRSAFRLTGFLIRDLIALAVFLVFLAFLAYLAVATTLAQPLRVEGEKVMAVRGAKPTDQYVTGDRLVVVNGTPKTDALSRLETAVTLSVPNSAIVRVVAGPNQEYAADPATKTILVEGKPVDIAWNPTTPEPLAGQLNRQYLVTCVAGDCGPADADLLFVPTTSLFAQAVPLREALGRDK